jgi:hypothetical protein
MPSLHGRIKNLSRTRQHNLVILRDPLHESAAAV